jgi:phosphoglycolate phosphatase/putative hydrolase of the HAD superfamily
LGKQYIKPNVKAFIFDVDGTLYQQNKLHRLMFIKIVKYFFTNPIKAIEAIISILSFRYSLEKMRSMNSTNEPIVDKQLEIANAICSIKIDKIKYHVTRWMECEPLKLLYKVKYPYSDLFFFEAKKKGYKLAIWSDYPIKNKLEALGWNNVFDMQLSSMDLNINKLKPNPIGINYITKYLGLTADEVIYVGDRYELDTKTASNAGVDCIIIRKNKKANKDYKYNIQTYLNLYNGLKNV